MERREDVTSTTIGYPRIGRDRELKYALEDVWSGDASEEELRETAREVRRNRWEVQTEAGVDIVPSNDFSLYDHVLDTACIVGAIPERYVDSSESGDEFDLETYFAMARGRPDADLEALEMTKWFDTNYHYIVPELEADQSFEYRWSKPVDEFEEAREASVETRPRLLGPVSFLQLAKPAGEEFETLELLENLLPAYADLLDDLEEAGADEVQFEEPCLVLDQDDDQREAYRTAYETLFGDRSDLGVTLTTYFGELRENLETAFDLPVDGVQIDLARGDELDRALEQVGEDQHLTLGVVDGRNVWRSDVDADLDRIGAAVDKLGGERVRVAPSCSLLYVPHDVEREEELDETVKSWLAFAEQKLDEVVALAEAGGGELSDDSESVLEASRDAVEARAEAQATHRDSVRDRMDEVDEEMASRDSEFAERKPKQNDQLDLPQFPTTVIGSFPQRSEVRKKRAAFKRGDIDREAYESFIGDEIERTIRAQEEMGLDLLVHGESERSDMVEYFGQQLSGFAFTNHGWVQSYGSRCVRPPIIYGDVERDESMTVEWTTYADELTDKPVKGILTGPVTMLQWSFVRDDQPRADTARQIALAMRDEVADLEEAGISFIQVDEPAIREGLPLRESDWSEYLDWAVEAFRLTTSVVDDATQVQTHMCYADFEDILESVAAMDADALFIEASRSDMRLLEVFDRFEYPNDIGPGVYDIHSPRIPSTEEMVELLEKALERIEADKLWVVPDCGLKTRNWDEVRPSLENMVEAAEEIRRRKA